MISRFYTVLVGVLAVSLHDVHIVATFSERRDGFLYHELLVVIIVCLIELSQKSFPFCTTAAFIDTMVYLNAMCLGYSVNANGFLYAVAKSCEVVISYSKYFLLS